MNRRCWRSSVWDQSALLLALLPSDAGFVVKGDPTADIALCELRIF